MRLWVGEASDTRRSLNRQVIRLRLLSRRWFKGIRAVVEHGLGESEVGVHSMHVEVLKHGVGFPSAEELDGMLVDVCAEESGGASRSETARADEFRRDAGGVFEVVSRMSECVCDV